MCREAALYREGSREEVSGNYQAVRVHVHLGNYWSIKCLEIYTRKLASPVLCGKLS